MSIVISRSVLIHCLRFIIVILGVSDCKRSIEYSFLRTKLSEKNWLSKKLMHVSNVTMCFPWFSIVIWQSEKSWRKTFFQPIMYSNLVSSIFIDHRWIIKHSCVGSMTNVDDVTWFFAMASVSSLGLTSSGWFSTGFKFSHLTPHASPLTREAIIEQWTTVSTGLIPHTSHLTSSRVRTR